MTGRYPNLKSSFIQLMNNLRFTPNAPGPNLRIGGNSADTSWWDPNNLPKPPKITYNIGPIDLNSVHEVALAMNGTVVFDLNFRQPNDPTWAVNDVKGVVQYTQFTRISGLEIGNECDLYHDNGIRPSNFTFAEYERQWANYVRAIYAISGVPKPHIQGATFCCLNPSFDAGLPGYMTRNRDLLSSVSYHRYPLNHCGGNIATMAQLLADSSSVHQAQLMAPFAKVANTLDLPFYIGEGNSVACGGMPNVSNVFGSALWGMDFMFNMAAVNILRINFHGGGEGYYTPIGYKSPTSEVPDVRPLYYAMWVFARVTSYNAVILETNTKTTNNLIKTWAVRNTQGKVIVVVIHKDMASTSGADVTVSSYLTTTGDASLYLLKSKDGLYGEYGINFAGQTFDGTTTGAPSGNLTPTKVPRSGSGTYSFTLPVTTIAVLELP